MPPHVQPCWPSLVWISSKKACENHALVWKAVASLWWLLTMPALTGGGADHDPHLVYHTNEPLPLLM